MINQWLYGKSCLTNFLYFVWVSISLDKLIGKRHTCRSTDGMIFNRVFCWRKNMVIENCENGRQMGRCHKGTPIVRVTPTVFEIGNYGFSDQLYIYSVSVMCISLGIWFLYFMHKIPAVKQSELNQLFCKILQIEYPISLER